MKTDSPSVIPADAGYVFNFRGHGAFDPNGRVAVDPVPDTVAAHNAEVSAREIAAMRETGRAILYLIRRKGTSNLDTPGTRYLVGTWNGSHKWTVYFLQKSWHNMAGKDGRTDVWFTDSADGSRWHGVNIGDNDIVRCKRCKS